MTQRQRVFQVWGRVEAAAPVLRHTGGKQAEPTHKPDQRGSGQRARREEWLKRLEQISSVLPHGARGSLAALHRALAVLERLPAAQRLATESMVLRVQRELAHLERLVNDLHDVARPLALEPRPCDLSLIWRRAWRLAVADEGRQAVLRERIECSEVQLLADADRLQQLFRSLFENALQACPEPAKVTIRCRSIQLQGVDALAVAVQDNGPGLTDQQHASIFKPFESSKSDGMGLGLTIARRIVEAHSGTLTSARSPAGGAEFRFTLPLSPL